MAVFVSRSEFVMSRTIFCNGCICEKNQFLVMGVVMSGSNNISKLLLVSRGVFRVTGVGRDSSQSRAGRGDRQTN